MLRAAGESVAGFLDDGIPPGTRVMDTTVLGDTGWLDIHGPGARVALGIGDNAARERIAKRCEEAGATLVTAVHPRAVVAPSALLEDGVVVMALAVVNADARVGRGAIINTAAVVEHDCIVGAFAHVSPNASMGGSARLGARAQLGLGATLLPGRTVNQDALVGAGAVVTREVGVGAVVLGVPAAPRS